MIAILARRRLRKAGYSASAAKWFARHHERADAIVWAIVRVVLVGLVLMDAGHWIVSSINTTQEQAQRIDKL